MEHYQKGNELYVAGLYAEAARSYSLAAGSESSSECRLKATLNRAQCFLRTEQYLEAARDCSEALGVISQSPFDESNAILRLKALLRRADAHEHLGNFGKALNDLDLVLQDDPPELLRKAALSSNRRLKSLLELDRVAAKEDGRPATMVTDSQALRLNFLHEPPNTFTVGVSYAVRLCITNELGLWNRSLLEAGVTVADYPILQCSLVHSSPIESNLIMHVQSASAGCNGSEMAKPLCVGADGKVDIVVRLDYREGGVAAHNLNEAESVSVVMLRFALDRPIKPSGEVLPILSLPAGVVAPAGALAIAVPSMSPEYARFVEQSSAVHATCVREMHLSSHNLHVYALESPGFLGIAGKVWDSMFVLLQYLALHTERLVRGKRIIELGCGTGLAGISLCTMDPQSVTLTDMREVVPLISANVLLNSVMVDDHAVQAVLRQRYQAAAYCWGGSLDLEPDTTAAAGKEGEGPGGVAVQDKVVPYFDVILASDVVYYPEGYQPLLATLGDLLGAKDDMDGTTDHAAGTAGPVCILAHRHRHPEDSKFFDALFASTVLCAKKLDFQAQLQGCGSDSSSSDGVQALKDVILFEITRR